MNNNFNETLIVSEKEEPFFQQSNSCCICKKIIDNDGEKVRDHYHVTDRFRGAAHWNCNIPANICWSSRRLQDVFRACLEDVFNTSSE